MKHDPTSRRAFLRAGGLVAFSAFVPSWGCDRNEVTFLDMPTAPVDMPSDTPMDQLPAARITPNDRFYLQSINGQPYDPRIRADNWAIAVDGLVERPEAALGYEAITAMPIQRQVMTMQCIGNWIGGPLVGNAEWGGTPIRADNWAIAVDGLVERPEAALRYEAITAMPMQRQVMTMQCIGNWIGGPLVGNAEWGGTPFRNLLDQVGVRAEATRVKFTSVDGYTTSIPIERALRDNVLLTWEMNGEVLPSKHGYPVRLINPGHYGQKMPKWITRIELIDFDYLGYWESKPEGKDFKWSDDAIATVNSRIEAPLSLWDDEKDPGNGGVSYVFQTLRGAVGDTYTIHGIAMAGERTVARVEVSTDGGSTWGDAHLTSRAVPNVWVTWSFDWSLPVTGRYEVLARATDSAGDTQPKEDKGVDLYDGRTGWHSVPVNVSTS